MNKDFAPLRPGSKPHLQFTMENQTVSAANSALVAEAYGQFNRIIEAFISRRIADRAEVENLTQDVWMKALTYTQPLCGETLKAFLFTVARNLVNDRLTIIISQRACMPRCSVVPTFSPTTSNRPSRRQILPGGNGSGLSACPRSAVSFIV